MKTEKRIMDNNLDKVKNNICFINKDVSIDY